MDDSRLALSMAGAIACFIVAFIIALIVGATLGIEEGEFNVKHQIASGTIDCEYVHEALVCFNPKEVGDE